VPAAGGDVRVRHRLADYRRGAADPDADPASVAAAIVRLVDSPFGKRPFRVHVDPSQDGAEIVNGVADRMRAELFRRIGIEDLLVPHLAEVPHGESVVIDASR
jgi:hypothetical protein